MRRLADALEDAGEELATPEARNARGPQRRKADRRRAQGDGHGRRDLPLPRGRARALLDELNAKDPVKAARRFVHVPMGRFAEPREIASAALFLASDESSYVKASTFLVGGGLAAAYVTPEQGPTFTGH
jgi:hypothetical protein